MSGFAQHEEGRQDRIILDLLNLVERDSVQSQRRLASELGIALGLVNACLKRCVKKGLVKVNEAPARRYAYYLTPQGFAEKSRLTVEYLSYSLSFFRQARADYTDVMNDVRSRGWSRVLVAGHSDLTEIARICARDSGVDIVAFVDPQAIAPLLFGVPAVRSFAEAPAADAIIVADLHAADSVFADAIVHADADRVFAPKLLGLRPRSLLEAGQ